MLLANKERMSILEDVFEKFSIVVEQKKVEPSDLLNFYRNIFLQKPGLVVCMSRKSWRVINLFLPFLKEEGIVDENILTHDRMIHPWFAEKTPEERRNLKVFVIDDTFQTGRAIDDCLRRLKFAYNIDEKNITVAVFAVANDRLGLNSGRIDMENNLYTVYESSSRPGIGPFKVNWGGRNVLYPKEKVSLLSSLFVESLHACSEPYVGYIPAFRIPMESLKSFLGNIQGKEIESEDEPNIRIPGYLEQDDLRPPLNDPAVMGYFNITSLQMRQIDVEAFYFLLPGLDSDNRKYQPFLPTKDALSIAALRFYLNHKTGIALVVPYISLKDCKADADIVGMFPEEIKKLLNVITTPTENWKDREENLAAYRLLRYASGYLWGKYVLKQWFGIDVKEDNIASNGGICSKTFLKWLNGDSAVLDIKNIWSFFDPANGFVVEEQQESEENLEKIINGNLSEEQAKDFCGVISNQMSIMPTPQNYYTTISMMFRRISDREREILNNYAEAGKRLFLPPSFQGLPLHAFFYLLLAKFPQLKNRRDVLITVTLMLCDMGIAVTQLCQRQGVIGTSLLNGEQASLVLEPVAPQYAHFLSEFPELVKNLPKEKRREKFEMAKKDIKEYFEDEIKNNIDRRLSPNELMTHLDSIKPVVVDNPEREFCAYSVLPRNLFFDCSELFFLKLREKVAV